MSDFSAIDTTINSTYYSADISTDTSAQYPAYRTTEPAAD
jgi:hypothetical protein